MQAHWSVSARRDRQRWPAMLRAPAPTLAHHRQLHRLTLLAALACVLFAAGVGGLSFAARLVNAPLPLAAPTASGLHSNHRSATSQVGDARGEQTASMIDLPSLDRSTLPFASLWLYTAPPGREPPLVRAQAAFLFDPERGVILYEKSADDPRPIASLTKVMTLLLTVETGNLDRLIRIGPDAAALVTGANSYMGVSTGEQLTLRQLLYGLVVGSGNDAAVAIADGVSGTTTAFVALMNSRAWQLGLTQTHFVSPDGVDVGNRSTAQDLALLTALVIETPGVEQVTSMGHASIPQTATHKAFDLWSSNDLLPGGSAPYPGATGVKTGYTERALYCLAFAVRRQGHLLVGVVLGDPSADARDADAHALLDWGFAQE